MTLRVIELFAGVGAQAKALENLGIDHEVVAVAENDAHAFASYEAIHGKTYNLGDITKVEHLPECDLLTYSFPCQDLSMAGLHAGCAKGSGTRSGLLWEVERLLLDMRERERLPLTLLMENVDALLFKENIGDFKKWVESLSSMGYTSSYKVLNAADFGIPQRRKRLFMISRLDGRYFDFPKPVPLTLCLKDLLEENVPESYYLDEETVAKFVKHKERNEANGNGFGWPSMTAGDKESNPLAANPKRHATGSYLKE